MTLLDRAPELEAIARGIASAQDGTGALLVIEGQPGIGKSRLLHAACERAAERRMRVLTARGGELERGLPFGVTRQLLEPLLTVPELFGGAAELARPVLAAPDHAGSSSFATLHGLYWLVANAAARPVLLAVDDAHWSDAPSLRFIAYLAARIEGLRALLIVTARPADEPALAALAAQPAAAVVRPRPLGAAAVRALLEQQTGAPAGSDLAERCRRATGGNPFLLGELVRELREDPAGAAHVERLAPAGVQRAVLRRLAALPDGAAALARAVAILGDGADPRHATALAGVADAEPLLDALARADVLERRLPPAFVHPLVRSAVLGALGPGERAAAHRSAAQVLADAGAPRDQVAAQLLVSLPRGEQWTVAVLRDAARDAEARGAPEVAARHLRRALAEPPDDRAGVLFDLGGAEARAGMPEALERLKAAVDAAADDVVQRARAGLALTRALFFAGRFEDAVGVSSRALDELGDAAPALALELEVELLGAARQDLRTRPIALERLARRTADPEPVGPAECMMLANLANEEMAGLGARRRSLALSERALSGGWLLGEEAVLSLPLAVTALTVCGRLDRSIDVWGDAIVQARARGSVLGYALASTFRSFAHLYRGDSVDVLADARSAVDAAASIGAALVAPYAAAFGAFAHLARGEPEAATAVLASVAVGSGPDAPFAGNYVLAARGSLYLEQGRAEDAAAELRECARRLARWRTPNPGLIRWRAPLALAELALGDRAEAARLAADTVALTREWGADYALAEALRVAGIVAEDVDLLRESVAAAERSGARLEHARSLTELGAALRRAGARREAREPLRTALDVAVRASAGGVAVRAQEELVAAGAQPRRLRRSGVEALTPTERRVAAMAADGMTNRELAQALFVSEKTVETHLRHAYRKLGIASRSQLAAALAGP